MVSQHVAPIPCKPWTLDGLPDDLIVSHYEHNYGSAVRALNAVRDRLAGLEIETTPDYELRSLKREELAAMGSVALHEIYFESLGGDGAVSRLHAARRRILQPLHLEKARRRDQVDHLRGRIRRGRRERSRRHL